MEQKTISLDSPEAIGSPEVVEMFGKPEELCFELKSFIEDSPLGGRMIRHPLVATISYHEIMNGNLNRALEYNRKRLREAIDKEKWDQVVFIHERPWRLQAFLNYIHKSCRLPTRAAGDLLTEVWKDCEFPWANRATWIKLFNHYAPHSPIMTRSRSYLPHKEFTVYRGIGIREGTTRRKYGISWTLDHGVAAWFARRFGNTKGKVLRGIIKPEHAFAYLPERAEQEVVINSNFLLSVTEE